jgi:flagellar basal-body rod modification protein FlgD
MSISSTSPLSTSGTQLATSNSTSSLGQSDFLQLMMDQLQHQDPLSPNDPTQYLSELAQFSSLEQMNNVATTNQASANETAATEALALVGKNVTYTDAAGTGQTGTVSSVQFTSTGPTLTIGASSGVALSNVTEAS